MYKRVSALSHTAMGCTRTKVIFRNEDGKEKAYWMLQETYQAFPLGEDVTLEDFQRVGYIVECQNTDIYNIETDSSCYKYTDCNN